MAVESNTNLGEPRVAHRQKDEDAEHQMVDMPAFHHHALIDLEDLLRAGHVCFPFVNRETQRKEKSDMALEGDSNVIETVVQLLSQHCFPNTTDFAHGGGSSHLAE
jgi:hypothetical protein